MALGALALPLELPEINGPYQDVKCFGIVWRVTYREIWCCFYSNKNNFLFFLCR